MAREVIRQGKKDLALICDAKTSAGELLVGAGCLARIEMAYLWIGVVGQGRNFRRAVEEGVPRRPEILDYSMFAMSMRFLAGSLGLGFMPTTSLLASDIAAHNPSVKLMQDPYSSKPVALVPAANPDVAFIHVQRCDPLGNAVIVGNQWNDATLARAARKTVVTCEKIVDEDEIRRNPMMTTIPHYCVDAVVHLPYGAHPEPVDGCYWMDQPFRRNFVVRSKTRQGFLDWLDEWVWGCPEHQDYLDKLGPERLAALAGLEKKFRKGMVE